MSFEPLNDRVFVRVDNPESITKSGLIIPERAQKPTGTGVVTHVGPGMLMKTGARWPMPCQPGERVIFDAQNPWPTIEIEGEKLLSMRDDAILAVIDPE
jgi:chaperonin GroES